MDIITAVGLGGKEAPTDRSDSSEIQWKTQTPETLSLILAGSLEAPEKVIFLWETFAYIIQSEGNLTILTSHL